MLPAGSHIPTRLVIIFGHLVSWRCETLGISRRQLCRRFRLSLTSLHRFERGSWFPRRRSTIERFARAFGFSPGTRVREWFVRSCISASDKRVSGTMSLRERQSVYRQAMEPLLDTHKPDPDQALVETLLRLAGKIPGAPPEIPLSRKKSEGQA